MFVTTSRALAVLAFAGAVLGSQGAAQASTTLVVGAAPTGTNVFPFGFSDGGSFYQQVYAASDFASPISISGLQFYAGADPVTVSNGVYTISLSATAAAVDALSTNPANNIGANDLQVFSDSIAQVVPGGGIMTLLFSQAFSYNPGAGNLLVNITIANQEFGFGGFLANNGDANGIFSRVTDFGGGYEGYGLETGFIVDTPAAVPEPATWALLLGGFALAGVALRRRTAALA